MAPTESYVYSRLRPEKHEVNTGRMKALSGLYMIHRYSNR